MNKDENGRGLGGSAIVTGVGAHIELDNEGVVQAGKGGDGGNGGDAIRIAPGIKIIIKNRGVIAGGDAGQLDKPPKATP